jgi:hypothetical protein
VEETSMPRQLHRGKSGWRSSGRRVATRPPPQARY